MIVYPAIDLKDGRCVRLVQGDMKQDTVYGEDPTAIAKGFEQAGASWLHVVDLDGAFAGASRNLEAIKAIRRAVKMKIQLGGGIRAMDQAAQLLEGVGLDRIILGTAALRDPTFLQAAVERYGSRIAVGIDAKNGFVAVNGWAEETAVEAPALAELMAKQGVATIIYTDISRDGMMQGPNFAATGEIIRRTGVDVIISGGVSSLEQLEESRAIGAAGAIVGKALYTGAIDLKETLRIVR